MIKRILLLSTIGLLSFNINAEESSVSNKEEDSIIKKIESGSLQKIADIKSNIFNQSYSKNNSIYFDIISGNFLPNFKLEYNNGTYKNKNDLSQIDSYLNDNVTFIDMNLQYGDVVSYYTLNSDSNFRANLGFGLRQYVGNIEYNKDNVDFENSITSTIPLSYVDVFYNLDSNSNSAVGTYIKESEFNRNTIKDSGLYFKTSIERVDNLMFMASYSTSNISFLSNEYKSSLIESEGLNLQLKYVY